MIINLPITKNDFVIGQVWRRVGNENYLQGYQTICKACGWKSSVLTYRVIKEIIPIHIRLEH